jgi:HlyD family secretion protein
MVSRNVRRILILAALVISVLILRWTFFRSHPVSVSVVAAERGRVESSVVNSRAGTVESRLRAEMSPGIAGLVAEIPVKKGQAVRSGEVLLRIDDDEHVANASLAEKSLDAARATSREACLSAEQAARELHRAEGLFERNLASDQQLEDAQTKAQVAEAGCIASRARTQQAEAALRSARAILAKTVMKAPFSGVVLDVTTEVGEWISPSPPVPIETGNSPGASATWHPLFARSRSRIARSPWRRSSWTRIFPRISSRASLPTSKSSSRPVTTFYAFRRLLC